MQEPSKKYELKRRLNSKKKNNETDSDETEEEELQEAWKNRNRSANSQSILEPVDRKLQSKEKLMSKNITKDGPKEKPKGQMQPETPKKSQCQRTLRQRKK